LRLVLAVGVGLVCACAAVADDAVSAPECSAKVCAINVYAKNLVTEPCVGYSVLVVYSTANGATLIQCSKFQEPEANRLFVYDRLNREVKSFEFDAGRSITAEALATAETEGIPDKFASRPLCAAKHREAPHEGELVFIEKRPNNSEDNPYCYRAYYVGGDANSLRVRSDEGSELSSLRARETKAQEWTKLKATLARYIDAGQAGPAKQARTAPVIADKAALFRSPDAAATSQMYLVKGDRVEIVDESKSASGWVLVRYVTKSGKNIERWIQMRDLGTAEN